MKVLQLVATPLRSTTLAALAGLLACGSLDAQPPPPKGSANPQAQQLDSQLSAPRSEADSLLELGRSIQLDQPFEAIRIYHRAFEVARSQRDSIALAGAMYRIGITYWNQRQLDSATKYLEESLVLERPLGDPVALARVYNGIGATYYQLGIYEKALEAFLQALPLRRNSTDSVGLARTLTNIGKVYHDWGQFDRAHSTLTEAVEVARKATDGAAALGYALNSLAMLQIDRGDLSDARRLMGESIAAYSQPGGRFSLADSIASWEFNATSEGLLLLREGNTREAISVLTAVLKSTTDRKSDLGRAKALLYLGEASTKQNNVGTARSQFAEALKLARAGEQRIVALEALNRLSDLEYNENNASAAIRYFREYRALSDTIFDQDAALRIASREARAETDAALQANQILERRAAEQRMTISRQRIVVTSAGLIIALISLLLVMVVRYQRREAERAKVLEQNNVELGSLNEQLRSALAEVRTLSGLIPICANCKKIRDDQGYWNAVETFITEHSDATFSHSICQECGPKLYGDLWHDTSEHKRPDSDRASNATREGGVS